MRVYTRVGDGTLVELNEGELSKSRVQLEAETVLQEPELVDLGKVRSYVQDLKSLLEEADLIQSKTFLRTFIRRIEINKKQAVVHYTLPIPPKHGKQQSVEVLPIVTPGGEGGTRTPTPCGT